MRFSLDAKIRFFFLATSMKDYLEKTINLLVSQSPGRALSDLINTHNHCISAGQGFCLTGAVLMDKPPRTQQGNR